MIRSRKIRKKVSKSNIPKALRYSAADKIKRKRANSDALFMTEPDCNSTNGAHSKKRKGGTKLIRHNSAPIDPASYDSISTVSFQDYLDSKKQKHGMLNKLVYATMF